MNRVIPKEVIPTNIYCRNWPDKKREKETLKKLGGFLKCKIQSKGREISLTLTELKPKEKCIFVLT